MTQLVGILNITPDSFSDGGLYSDPDASVGRIYELIEQGADIIDIGAESTRPNATALNAEQEWGRFKPLCEAITSFDKLPVGISIDSRHYETIGRVLPYGISVINDVSGFASDDMIRLAAGSQCDLVVMHSLSIPADPNHILPEEQNPVAAVLAFAEKRITALVDAGIAKERIIFDPGIGFGKNAEQSIELIRHIDAFSCLGVRLYVGHSRKSFLQKWGGEVSDKDALTLKVSRFLIDKNVDYLRVHDVAAHKTLLTEYGNAT